MERNATWRKLFVASCRELQAGSVCSPACSLRCLREITTLKFFLPILMACFANSTAGMTLESVLQTTLEKNPAIQEAKSGFEQATGQRLVFRSIVWPHVELGVPAGVQAGHRAAARGATTTGGGRGNV